MNQFCFYTYQTTKQVTILYGIFSHFVANTQFVPISLLDSWILKKKAKNNAI